MKKFIGFGLVLLMCVGMLAGCGSSLNVDTNTIYVKKNGRVISADVETFDKDYYDQEEFKTYVDAAIEEYNAERNNAVKLLEFEVKENVASVHMSFQSAGDYSAFNQMELFSGSIAEAKEAGYTMEVPLIEAKEADGTNTEEVLAEFDAEESVMSTETEFSAESTEEFIIEGSLEPATEAEVEEVVETPQAKNLVDSSLLDDTYQIIIVRAHMDVKVDGTIEYVTNSPDVIVNEDADTVSIKGKQAEAESDLVYIIYKQ